MDKDGAHKNKACLNASPAGPIESDEDTEGVEEVGPAHHPGHGVDVNGVEGKEDADGQADVGDEPVDPLVDEDNVEGVDENVEGMLDAGVDVAAAADGGERLGQLEGQDGQRAVGLVAGRVRQVRAPKVVAKHSGQPRTVKDVGKNAVLKVSSSSILVLINKEHFAFT